MNIVYITAGAAGMYCGTCMHDNALAAGLMRRGHDVLLLPAYTPTRTDEANVASEHIAFGALNVYLQQKSSFFRRRHRLLDRLLDHPRVLGWVSKLAGSASTDAAELGGMTLSMLRGENGYQAVELEKLIDTIEELAAPEVVHLSHTLFAGFARRIKERLGVPVVSSLAGEDLFFDELDDTWRPRVVDELRRRVVDVDAFTAPCRYYADLMSHDYGVAGERVAFVPLGVEADDLLAIEHPPRRDSDQAPTVGYLARQAPEKGLHQLIDAFRLLAAEHPSVRLRIAGYLGAKDQAYVDDLRARVDDWGLGSRVDWLGEVDRDGKVAFFESLDVFSVPTVYREPKGRFVAEAMAAGVPVVQPHHGSFPEWIERTGGGVLVTPGDERALADGLRTLLDDPARRHALGAAARAGVRAHHGVDTMCERMIAFYERVLAGDELGPLHVAHPVAARVDETPRRVALG
ncbi:MAG: glycosyltransferase family 4 protein [Acidobacteriota bacterium]